MSRKPKYKVGQRVNYRGDTGIIRTVIPKGDQEPEYSVDFFFAEKNLRESLIQKI